MRRYVGERRRVCFYFGFLQTLFWFYASTGVCHVIALPQRSARFFERPKKGAEETLTISCGSLMYMKTESGIRPNQQLKIWKLKKYTSGFSKKSWKLLWDLRFGLCLATEPVAMHPFVEEIIYLVTRQTEYSETNAYLVSGNLYTKKFQLHEDWKQEHRESEDYQSHHFHSLCFHKDSAPFLVHLAALLLPFPTNTS